MAESDRRFGIFILGAGFSCPAGLPDATELWREVLNRAGLRSGRAGMLQDDIDTYTDFRRRCDGVDLAPKEIDFEDFLGFLDVEHHLGLRGSDTWSNDGNESQVLIKTLIGQILAERTPSAAAIDGLYLDFARVLQPGDLVLTFNYDILLERALDQVGKPYRLVPHRYSSVGERVAEVDSSRDEIIVLKLHGSIDWFDRRSHMRQVEAYSRQGISEKPAHPVFNTPGIRVKPIVEGSRFPNDSLGEMYRLVDVEKVYKNPPLFRATPWLLNPSTMKILHSDSVKDFWWGLGGLGTSNLNMAVIGYSMPAHDEYARQAFYRIVSNYQREFWDEGVLGRKKAPLLVVDLRKSEAAKGEFLQRYACVDWQKARLHLDGFTHDLVKALLADSFAS